MNTSNVRWPDSLWAAMTPSGPDLPELTGTQQADVIVIGGGFTGLSTALHLREAGVDVAIVEAAEPGWGASGRNNGQVIPTLSRPDPEDIVAKHGEAGERFVGMLRDSASYLFEVTRRYSIEAEAEQAGWVQPVHSPVLFQKPPNHASEPSMSRVCSRDSSSTGAPNFDHCRTRRSAILMRPGECTGWTQPACSASASIL